MRSQEMCVDLLTALQSCVREPRNLWQKRLEELRGTSWNAPAWWPLSQIHLADILRTWTPQCQLREHWDGGQFGIDSLQVRDWWSPFRLNRGVHNRTCALGEPPLELTPRVSPSAQARWEIELHRTTCDERWPLWWLYSSSLPPTTPAEEWQSMELKAQLKVKKRCANFRHRNTEPFSFTYSSWKLHATDIILPFQSFYCL